MTLICSLRAVNNQARLDHVRTSKHTWLPSYPLFDSF